MNYQKGRPLNDFDKAAKLISDIWADTNKVKSSFGDKKVFNDLNRLINVLKNKKKIQDKAPLKK